VRNSSLLIAGFVCGLLAGAQETLAAYPALANHNKAGLYANSIEKVMRLEEQDIDIATAVLLLSRQVGADINYKRYCQRIDDMAYAVLEHLRENSKLREQDFGQQLPDAAVDYRAIPVINRYLFEELGFEPVKTADDPRDLFLHYVLDRKKGYCLSLSILYLALGERLGLPLYGVVVPEHFFVRYDDGQVRFNIETTARGNSAPDEHYVKKFRVPAGEQNQIYMKNLTPKQTLSCFFNNLSNIYQELGDLDSATILLERAVDLTPGLAMVRTNLGNIYLQNGRIEEAMSQYRLALEIHPDEAKTRNNLGNAYLQAWQQRQLSTGEAERGWFDAAASEFKLAISLDPNCVDSYKNLARVYEKQGLSEQALAELDRAAALAPQDSEVCCQSGDVYRQMSDPTKAIASYNKALLIEPDSVQARSGLALTYRALGLVEDEIKIYNQILELAHQPGLKRQERQRRSSYIVPALMNLGNAYCEKQMYDQAIEQYRKALALDKDNALLHHNLAAAYFNKKDYNSAVIEYAVAVRLQADLAQAHNGLAMCYYFLDRHDLAWKHINTAKQLGFAVSEELYKVLAKKYNR
jgi:tetratricopeptide (TPR) repeat protein